MRIASWNVNSMKARIEHVLAFLELINATCCWLRN